MTFQSGLEYHESFMLKKSEIDFKELIGFSLLFVMISVTFSMPIKHFTGMLIYPFFLINFFIFTAIFILSKLCFNYGFGSKVKGLPTFFLIFYVILHFYGWVSGIYQNGILASTLGLVGYTFYSFPVLVLIAGGVRLKVLERIVIFNCYFAVIVGGVGLYQLLFDPLLLGIYSGTKYESFDIWAVQRVSSIMGSMQVYSAYMLFSLLAIVNFKPFGLYVNLFYLLVIFVLGALGGSQLFFVLAPILVVFYVFKNLSVSASFLFAFSVFIIFSTMFITFGKTIDFGAFERLSDLLNGGLGLLYDLNEKRFSIWFEAVRGSNFFYGNGFGSASILVSGAERFNTESFILSAYYEGGFLFASFYAFYFLVLPLHAVKDLGMAHAAINSVVYLSYAFSVHVYFGVLLIIPWILLLRYTSIVNPVLQFGPGSKYLALNSTS